MVNTTMIATETVRVPSRRLRAVVEDVVKDLAESISTLGLLEPIVVTSNFTLIAGLHRLRAHQRLERRTILARIVELNELQAELAELDENLIRAGLSVLEEAEHLQRRKEIYEALHPDTRHGVAGGLAGGRGRLKQVRGPSTATPSFAHEVGRRLGVSERHVQQSVQIGRILPQVRELLRGSSVASNREALLTVARARPAAQEEVARHLLGGGKSSHAAPTVRPAADRPDLIMAAHVGTSATIFPNILALHVPDGATVADVTYGQGVFWTHVERGRYQLLASDLADGIDCRHLPHADSSIDAVVLDPPFMHSPGGTAYQTHGAHEAFYRNNATEAPEGTRYHEAVVRLYVEAARETLRVLRPRGILIVKCQDTVCAGRLHLTHVELIQELSKLGFRLLDLFLLVARNAPTVSRLRKQRTGRRNYSCFLVARAPKSR